MALSKSFSAQAALKTCDEHQMEELDMYCKTCEKPICEECLKQYHIQHDWCKISKMARQLRTEIPDMERKIGSQANAFFSGRRKIIKFVRERYDETMTGNTKNLERVRSEMHALVDNVIDEHAEECKNHREMIESELLALEATYSPCEINIKQLAKFFRTGSQKYNDFDLIELYDKLKSMLDKLDTFPELTANLFEQRHFMRHKLDKDTVKSFIGSVVAIDPNSITGNIQKIAELNIGEEATVCINVRSDNEALMSRPKAVQLITIDGDVRWTRRRDTTCYNFATTSDVGIILCDRTTNEVKMIDKFDKCSVLFNTGNLHPAFVTITNAGELLISMWDEDSYSRTSSSRRLVRRMTMEGEEVCVYEYDNDGKTPLFTRPTKTVQHNNGDVCIIDRFKNNTDMATGVVYGFDIRGNVKFRYTGRQDKHPFNPLDMCCDMLGNTITSDTKNHNVHMIDTEGNFIRYLVTPDMVDRDLYAVSLYGNKLWVGAYDTGVVYVFEFN